MPYVVDTPYRGGVLCLKWWIHHTELGFHASCGRYGIQRRGVTLDVVEL